MNILFVDDNSETRDLFTLCFRLQGHVAETAQDGPEALRVIAQKKDALDVIIMDYHMPKMTGIEVVQQLRQMKDGPSVPILLFTGDTRGNIEGEARDLGVARVLYKPLMPAALITAAQEVVGTA